MWPQWTHNPDLSHGVFMPVICVFLLWQSRNDGTGRYPPRPALPARHGASGRGGRGRPGSWLGFYAAALDWSHALVTVPRQRPRPLLLGWRSGRRRRADPGWFPSAGAECRGRLPQPLRAPIPPGTYSRLTASLQLWISTQVVHALHLLGVAAYRTGNIIELANTRVGIEEACSGVRSLVSCVFAGLCLLLRQPGHVSLGACRRHRPFRSLARPWECPRSAR